MYFADTNIFLRILLEEDGAELCEKFLKKCEVEAIPVIVSSFSVHTIEVKLLKRQRYKNLKYFLEGLSTAKNIFLYSTDANDELEIFKLFEHGILNFEDSFQYYAALKSNCQAIVSYDPDFDNLDIKRKTPEELL